MKNKQFRIYKLNTFSTFTESENDKYNQIKDHGDSIKEVLPPILEAYEGQREVNPKALNMDNEIEIFESDLLRVVDELENEHELATDIIFMKIYHDEILKQLIDKGLKCNEKTFVFYTSSAGQTRKQTITLIEKEALEKFGNNLFNGLSRERINQHKEIINGVEYNGINLGKFLAYTSLSMSSSIPIEIDIDRVIVVPDFETIVRKEVEYIDNKTFESKVEEMDIRVNHADGAGMYLPGLLENSCQIRARWIKGAIFPFDYKKYALEVANNTKIVDIYGKEYDVVKDDIKLILSLSQFKMAKYYNSWDEYKKYFKENKLKFSITNEANPPVEKTELSYQFLQTLDPAMKDDTIENLCADTVAKIKNLYCDSEEMKRLLGATEDNTHLNPLQEALMMYPELLYDTHVKLQVRKAVRSYRVNAMGGKILADGFYSYIVPDFYSYCQQLFQGIENPVGLIPDGHIYNAYFNDKEVDKADLLRSPHLWASEHCIREFTRTDECKKWFEHMGSNTIVSCHDLTLLSLMADVDGDNVFVCTSKPILDSVVPHPPLYYEMFKATPQEINNNNIYESLIKAFNSNYIGDISNAITKEWNSNSKVNHKMIKTLQMYNNFTIDYPKTSANIELPSETVEKFEELKDQSNPYFFKYAKNKKKHEPINNSVVNRISKHIKSKTNNLKYKPFEEKREFNHAMLMNSDIKVRRDKEPYKLMQEALFKWDNKIQSLTRKISNASKKDDELKTKYDVVYQYCKEDLLKIYGGAGQIHYVVNALIDIEYNQPHNVDKQKNILWNCFGDIIVKNLNKNLGRETEIKSRPRLAYTTYQEHHFNSVKPKLIMFDTPRSVDITFEDYNKINSVTKKNKNDAHLLYVLICLCKSFNNELIISKSRKSKLTINKISILAGIKNFSTVIKRLEELKLINVKEDSKKKKMTISINSLDDGEIAFTVKNIWNPLLYIEKYEGKTIGKCKICGNEFVKIRNMETCSKKCSKEATRKKKKEDYVKLKESKKVVDNVG